MTARKRRKSVIAKPDPAPRRWGRDPAWLGGLLVVDLLLAVLVVWKVPFQAPNTFYLCDAAEFAATHRVASVFLPVGYSGLLGLSDRLGGRLGMTVLSIALSLGVIAAAWMYLRAVGVSLRATLALMAMLSVYPELLLSYNTAQDTVLTAALLFALVVLLLRALGAKRFGAADVLLGLTLGYAVMVRPGLGLLELVVWLAYWRFGVPRAFPRLAGQMAIVVGFYVAGTAVVHGRPFVPHDGPFNLYAGANEVTENYMANEENSLVLAMAGHGRIVTDPHAPCIQDSADPGRPDIHDRRLDAVYMQFALEFMREHPATMARLAWEKFAGLLAPDFGSDPPRSVGGVLKVLGALAFPLWVVAVLFWPHPGPRAAGFLVAAIVVAYVTPFVLTVSSPRFRAPLDYFLWMDLGAMVWARYFVSRPRPAA